MLISHAAAQIDTGQSRRRQIDVVHTNETRIDAGRFCITGRLSIQGSWTRLRRLFAEKLSVAIVRGLFVN